MRSVFFPKPHERPTRLEGVRWVIRVWLPVVLAVGIICVESTNTFSAQNTSQWLRPVFQHWFGFMSDAAWDSFHHYLRKSGHFLGYGAVGFTFLRAWLHTLDRRGPRALLPWRLESSILAILSTAIVASCDEIHQTFIPSRTGTPLDVLLDTTGATALCLLVWLICWSRRAPERDWEPIA
ncbi:MAG: VanZ family protein [Acidobacteriaceae bacterium]|jgi:VanZ family protein